MDNIRWGIIGCGDVTEIKSGPAFGKTEGSSLHMVMRRNKDKLVDYAKRHNVDRYTTDYLELLCDPQIDAVYIATPPNMHCHYALEAAKHKKDIYVEKPMATSVQDCKKMIEAAKANNVNLYTAYYRRGQDKFKTIKRIMESGEIGKIVSFSYLYTCKPPVFNPERAWLLDEKIAGEGLLYDIGSHMIDITMFLLGNIDSAHGISNRQSTSTNISDIVSGIVKFKSGIQGCMQFSFAVNRQNDELTIEGDAGSISFAIMNNEPIIIRTDQGERLIGFDDMQHVQMPYIADVINDISGMDTVDSSGLYGLRTQEVLEAFSLSKSVKFE